MNGISINDNIQADDLELKLKESTSLSEDQIKEIIPVILGTLSEIKDLEKVKSEVSTKQALSSLTQSIENNTDVSINMKNNKWTVIWAMNLNTVTNNISITINTPAQVAPQKPTQQTTVQQVAPQKPTQQTTVQQVAPQKPIQQTTVQQVAPQKPTQQTTVQQVVPQQPTQQTAVQQVVPQQPTQQTTVQQVVPQQPSPQTIDIQESGQSDIKLDNYEWYDKALSQLIFEIDWCRETANYKRWLNKSWKETLKTAKEKLKQYKDIISDKKRMLEHEFKQKNKLNGKNSDKVPLTVSISAAEINELKNRRFQRRQMIEVDIKEWQSWKSSNVAPWPNQSLEQVVKWNTVDRHHIEYDSKLNAALNDAAFLRIIDNNQDRAREFLQAIANNSLSEAQITICQMRKVQLDPYFEKYGLTDQVNRCIQNRWWRIEVVQWNSGASLDYRDMDRWETFQKWWLSWIIDKALSNCNNMTPGQRNTWKSLAVLWGVAAWLFWLYKFYTNKKMWFWGKALTTGGVILWSQILTWENPISLFGKLMTWWFTKEYLESKFWNAFGDAVSWVWNSWIEASNTLTPAMYSMMIFNSNTNVWDVRALRNRFKQNDSEWQSFRWDAITKLKTKYWDNSVQHFSATFSDKFDEEKWNNWLWSFWVTDSTADNKNIYELANNAAMNEIVIEKYRSEHGVKETKDAVKKKEFEEYVKDMKNKNQPINIEDLEAHPEWFELDNEATYTERPVDVQFKESLVNQTESLWINEPKKSELKTALKRFYDERTVDSKPLISDFSLKMDNDLLVLVSHSWQETKIDINKNEVVGLWNGIRFANLSDLLNVADLTNKILESQKWKVAVDYPPFQYKWPTSVLDNWVGKWWRWIYFNDAEWWSINFDTRVLSSGWWGIMGKIGSLWNHPEEYADYLSRRRIENNTVKIESTLYPMVKILSDSWIVFTREQEVKELEIWLKWIKEKLKVFKAYPSWNPFSIWTLSRKLEFKAINWDVQEFPENISDKFPTLTLVWNKEKFLKTINNPSNKMRWSVI